MTPEWEEPPGLCTIRKWRAFQILAHFTRWQIVAQSYREEDFEKPSSRPSKVLPVMVPGEFVQLCLGSFTFIYFFYTIMYEYLDWPLSSPGVWCLIFFHGIILDDSLFLYILLLRVIFFIWKIVTEKGGEMERDSIRWFILVISMTRVGPGWNHESGTLSRSLLEVAQVPGWFPATFPGSLAGSWMRGSEARSPASAAVWYAGIARCGLTCCATLLGTKALLIATDSLEERPRLSELQTGISKII